jgi:hypothetical protein
MGMLYYSDNLDILRRYAHRQFCTVKELMEGQGIERPTALPPPAASLPI